MDRSVSPGWTTYAVEPATTGEDEPGEATAEGEPAAATAGEAEGDGPTLARTIVGRPPGTP